MSWKPDNKGDMWWGYNMASPVSYNRVIKQIMKICRSTIEYEFWQIRTKSGIGEECPVCGKPYMYARPETHHYPSQMYNIVESVIQNHLHNGTLEYHSPLDIVTEIMSDHIHNRVGYIVLCKQCHSLFHDGHPETVDKVTELYSKSLKPDEEKEGEECEQTEEQGK